MYTIFPFGVNLFPLTNKFMKSYQSNKLNPFWLTNSNGMEKQEWLKTLTYWPIQIDCFAVKNYIILLHHTMRLHIWTSFDHMRNRCVLSNVFIMSFFSQTMFMNRLHKLLTINKLVINIPIKFQIFKTSKRIK